MSRLLARGYLRPERGNVRFRKMTRPRGCWLPRAAFNPLRNSRESLDKVAIRQNDPHICKAILRVVGPTYTRLRMEHRRKEAPPKMSEPDGMLKIECRVLTMRNS